MNDINCCPNLDMSKVEPAKKKNNYYWWALENKDCGYPYIIGIVPATATDACSSIKVEY